MVRKILSAIVIIASSFTIHAQDTILKNGNEYLTNKELDKAESVFRDGIRNAPDNLIYQCQLGLVLIQKEEYQLAQSTLANVLKLDSNNIAAIWYSAIGYYYDGKSKEAAARFEKAIPMLDKGGGQYYSANWFAGKCYANMLKTDGLTYAETDRMFDCFEEYIRLQPNATDTKDLRAYVDRKRQRHPSRNVQKWIDM
jgi:tetratricopeptide (TPR) repeat protein